MLPMKMPDLFEGDQLVVLGQFVGTKPLHFLLEGNYLGNKRTFKFKFALDKASKKNSFVPRLWASRKISFLIEAIREMGGNGRPASSVASDPRLKELVDEVIRLSTEFGILTEYTAFLAREGTDLAEGEMLRGAAIDNFARRAVSVRSGLGAVNQESNIKVYKEAAPVLNFDNAYFDADMNRVEVSGVQQVNDKAFYQRGNQWIDSRIAQKEVEADRTIEFGSKDFFDLVRRLAEENRNGVIAMGGDILLEIDDEVVLVKGPN
jgi:Ca-activated chloride channel family protein